MIDYKKELNPEQLKVVTGALGPCLVLAGAGSGKTRAIVYRAIYLLEHGVSPENILLLTFTNKAAREMLRRVGDILRYNPSKLLGGTFHHVSNCILRQYASVLGFTSNFTILDEEDSRDLIRLSIRDCQEPKNVSRDNDIRRFPSPAVLKNLISLGKNSKMAIDEILALRYPKFLPLQFEIQKTAGLYEKRKRQANSMDFDDLVLGLVELLRSSEPTRQKLGKRFKYILVDEYQDTNVLQAEMIHLLGKEHRNVLVVGDDAQSIYSFRGANVRNILEFPQIYPDCKTYKLTINYRSTPEILNLANNIILKNINQFFKKLRTFKDSFVKPKMVATGSLEDEARFIADKILELNEEEGVPFSEIAVLFRAAHLSENLEFELSRRNIPYEYRGGVRFFERSHIKDILAFLRIAVNVNDEVSWMRLLMRQVGIGPAGAGKIYQRVKNTRNLEEAVSLNFDSVLGANAQLGWKMFRKIVCVLLKTKTGPTCRGVASEMIRAVLNSEYVNYLETEFPNWEERKEDLEQLAIFAEKYTSPEAFLSALSLYFDSAGRKELGPEDGKDRIVLSTIHQAKGLEWETVILMGMTEGNFPNPRALFEEGGLEEERRLFYVSVTRAKKQLFLSYPAAMSGACGLRTNHPSRFLKEINEDLFDLSLTEGEENLPIVETD